MPFADSDGIRVLVQGLWMPGNAPTPAMPIASKVLQPRPAYKLNPFITLERGDDELIVRLSGLAPWNITQQFQELADHALFLSNRLTVNLGGTLYLETSHPDGVIFQGKDLGTHARVSGKQYAHGNHTARIDPLDLARYAFFPDSFVSVHGARPFCTESTPHSNPHVLMAINEIALRVDGHIVTVEYDKECCNRFSTLSSAYNSPIDY